MTEIHSQNSGHCGRVLENCVFECWYLFCWQV